MLVDVHSELLHVTRRRRRKVGSGRLYYLDVAAEWRRVRRVVVDRARGGGAGRGGSLGDDLLVVAAIERDDEADGRDRRAGGEYRHEQRQAVADVGPLGARLELVDALVVELLNGRVFEIGVMVAGSCSSRPGRAARYGVRLRAATFAGGHQSDRSAVSVGDPGRVRSCAQVMRLGARQQQSAQDRDEGLGVDLGSRRRGDRLGGCVGLLGGEPALLDGEGGAVARRVHDRRRRARARGGRSR